MRKIRASFTITTPMFLGGADNVNSADLKPTSVKGVLRFWFRAINYGKYQDYKEVKKIEDELFGSTTSQSEFFLKLDDKEREKNETVRSRLFSSPEIRYLGYGISRRKEYLSPGQSFTVELISKPNVSEYMFYEMINALKALGLFGGLGARSRRGFGSITLNSIILDDKEYWVAPTSEEELVKAIEDFYSTLKLRKDIPEYTAFSYNTRTVVLEKFSDYRSALTHIGREMMDYRKNYSKDTRKILSFLNSKSIDEHPERVAFGLPHNYFIRGRGKVDIIPVNSGGSRRASPLFIKVISINEGKDKKYIPMMTVLPSLFLPRGSKISLRGKRGKHHNLRSRTLDPKTSFKIINDFMDSFPDKLEVRPLD